MKALVLGGTGFVGMNVVRALVARGHDVTATRRSHANTLFARKLGARLVKADFHDPDSLVDAMAGREVVFMCAGHYPRFSLDLEAEVATARQAVRATLDAAKKAKVGRYVLTSSVATAGPPGPGKTLADERDPMAPGARHSVYFAVKKAIEEEALAAVRDGLDVVATCPTGIVGELDVKAGTGFVIVGVGNGMMPYHIDGRTNLIDADDMALGHVLAAERGKTGERYILGGHNTTIGEFLQLIARELDVPFRSWRLPLPFAAILSTLSEMRCVAQGGRDRPFIPREFVDVVRWGVWVSTARASQELGMPAPVPLAQTIRKACAWYARFRYLKPTAAGVSPNRRDTAKPSAVTEGDAA